MSAGISASTLVPRLLLGTPPGTRHVPIEGTCVLVDISGFTVLSERLASAGKQGTEELIATLSRVFTVLLSATDDGGDVLKFAGDALLVLYTGAEHERRAAHSAWVMQRVLAAIGDIRLRTAAARLRMSVGIRSGRFEVVLTGSRTRSAIVIGADTTRVLELQAAAGSGQILVDATTASALSPKQYVDHPAVGSAMRLVSGGAVPAESLMALHGVERANADAFLPRPFAERPDLLAAEPDHRWAAVGFVAVTGLPDAVDEAVLDEIDALTAAVEAAVEATGTTLLDIDPGRGGFRYFLTAGAPRAVEDPEGSLVTALHRIVATDTRFDIKAGAAAGRVFAGFVGAPFRQTYTTMGDTTNLAARLTSHAPEGTVVVTREVAARARVQVTAEDAREITVKGKSKPIAIATVAAVGERMRRAPAESPFVGRDEQIAQLSIRRDTDSPSVIVTVTGPAGIGKTSLIDEVFADRAVLRITGDRFAAGTAYGALRGLLRPLLGIPAEASPAEAGRTLEHRLRALTPDLLPWAGLLADMIGADCAESPAVRALDDAYRVERAHAVLGEVLGAALPPDSVIVVDDAQWIDAASAAAVGVVLPSPGGRAVVLRRESAATSDVAGEDADTIGLGPLSDEDATMLVESVMGRSPHPADLARILERAGGNPLYLVELAATGADDDEPRTLDELIGERIDGLSEHDRHIVRATAVLGLRVPRALFEQCVGAVEFTESDPLGEILRLDDAGAGSTIAFRSELYRDVAYDQLAFQERRRLHAVAAKAIAADPALAAGAADAMLAVHFEANGDWLAAADAARRNAEAAERAHAMEDAVASYRAAVAATRRARAPRAALRDLCELLASACYRCGRTVEAIDALDEARRLADSPLVRARIDCERAHSLNHLGRPVEAGAVLRRARRAARSAGESGRTLEARILVVDAAMRMRQSRWSDLLHLSREAIELLEGHADSAEAKGVLADAYRYHDIAASEIDGDDAMVHLQKALDLYEELGDAISASKVLTLIGIRAYFRGAWSAAASLYSRAQDASEAAGHTVGAAIDAANTAEILIDQGKIDLARPLLRRAARVFDAAADTYLVAFVEGFQGRALLREGDPRGAIASFDAAARQFDELGETESVLDVRVRRIEALLDLGETEAARGAIAAVEPAVGEEGILGSQLLRHRARLAESQGDDGLALTLSKKAVDAAGSTLFERALCLAQTARLTGSTGALLRAEAETILKELGVADIPALLDSTAPSPIAHPTHEEVVS
ncbi:hypothetical protein GCM10009775_15270 [Microbacterium aoyamense]|uniref:Guanylate cyclase domain-containing protein n=1 Tax=Microbacterium aoyamense TaxID=344166 RepID=A0ABN2PK16_9MICO|nr:adenylate/guanylate cyclase domain-containing protein [Microbacterium aoyamense]